MIGDKIYEPASKTLKKNAYIKMHKFHIHNNASEEGDLGINFRLRVKELVLNVTNYPGLND